MQIPLADSKAGIRNPITSYPVPPASYLPPIARPVPLRRGSRVADLRWAACACRLWQPRNSSAPVARAVGGLRAFGGRFSCGDGQSSISARGSREPRARGFPCAQDVGRHGLPSRVPTVPASSRRTRCSPTGAVHFCKFPVVDLSFFFVRSCCCIFDD